MKVSVQGKRACRAMAVVACLVAVAPASAQAFAWAGSAVSSAQSMEAIVEASMVGEEDDADKVVSDYARPLGVEIKDEASEAFRQECVDLSGREGAIVANDGKLVSYVDTRECEDAFFALAEDLEDKGWTWVKSGDDARATFVKDGGAYQWLYAACVDSGSGTSVVVQVVDNG